MIRRLNLRRDVDGSAAVEFALAVPVLTLFVYGFFTLGVLYQANAGLQHALGEAARLATIYVEANDGPPSDTEIRAMMAAKKFGLNGGTLGTLQITDISSAGAVVAKDLSLTYSQPTDFLFFPGPTVTLTRSKRVYIAN